MPEPKLAQLGRAMSQLQIGTIRNMQKINKMVEQDGLTEREEQFFIAVSGVAEEFYSWETVKIKFTTLFVDGTNRRDSPYLRPRISVGSELYTATPVALTAVVMEWETSDRYETVGATVAIGVSSTDLATKFRGAVHLGFQGFGQPLNTFDDEELNGGSEGEGE